MRNLYIILLFSVLPWHVHSQYDSLQITYEAQCVVINRLLADYEYLSAECGRAGGLDYVFTEKAERYLEIQRKNLENPQMFWLQCREYEQVVVDLHSLNTIIDEKSVLSD